MDHPRSLVADIGSERVVSHHMAATIPCVPLLSPNIHQDASKIPVSPVHHKQLPYLL